MTALETGVMEFDGEIVKQPRVELRPGPYASFKNRIYSATISPESVQIMAQLGTGVHLRTRGHAEAEVLTPSGTRPPRRVGRRDLRRR